MAQHLLLSVPAQLAAQYDDQLFTSSGTTITATDAPELVSKATLSQDAQVLLRQWLAEGPFTATTLAYKLKCEDSGCASFSCQAIDDCPGI